MKLFPSTLLIPAWCALCVSPEPSVSHHTHSQHLNPERRPCAQTHEIIQQYYAQVGRFKPISSNLRSKFIVTTLPSLHRGDFNGECEQSNWWLVIFVDGNFAAKKSQQLHNPACTREVTTPGDTHSNTQHNCLVVANRGPTNKRNNKLTNG